MSLKIDANLATTELFNSLNRVRKSPSKNCIIDATIQTVLTGEKCLTYQYILMTALVAKSTDPSVDMLSLQIDDNSAGAYAPRSLCKEVVYPFQKQFLENVLNGANNDPLVNKPARFLRLSRQNQARGAGKIALFALCDNLPKITTQAEARSCLDFLMTKLLERADQKSKRRQVVQDATKSSSATDLRKFLTDLLDQGFGGDALVLTVSALYRIQYPENEGFKVIPHPVNQPGTSKKQFSDLDVTLNGLPFLATELKDKPFVEDDVRHAAVTASNSGVSGVLFVSGRFGSLSDQTRGYFSKVRADFENKGVYIGLCDVDTLMDIILVSNKNIDAPLILQGLYDQVCTNAGTPEEQMWVYGRLSSLSK